MRCCSWRLEVSLNTFDYLNLCFHLFSFRTIAEDDKPETEEKKEGKDEEPLNLQLACEMLELATRGMS